MSLNRKDVEFKLPSKGIFRNNDLYVLIEMLAFAKIESPNRI